MSWLSKFLDKTSNPFGLGDPTGDQLKKMGQAGPPGGFGAQAPYSPNRPGSMPSFTSSTFKPVSPFGMGQPSSPFGGPVAGSPFGAPPGMTAGDGIMGALGGQSSGYDVFGPVGDLAGGIKGKSDGFMGGLSSMEKAQLLLQVLSGVSGTYGAYKQGRQEDRDKKKSEREKKAAAEALAPYLKRLLSGGG